jgi:predicted kinase
MVLVGGLPGSGKSTLAARLSDVLGWEVIRSDEIRKELAGVAHDVPAPPRMYRRRQLEAVYVELLRRAEVSLGQGVSVILDATWNRAASRRAARSLAASASAETVELRCTAPRSVSAERLKHRRPDAAFASDATPEVLSRMAFEAWPEAGEVETSGDVNRSLAVALALCDPSR